jgi:hypothetical protein
MQWTHLQEEHAHKSLKQKTSSQEGTIMTNAQEEVGREAYLKGPFKRMEQGKSSLASTAENPVTLHKIVNRKSGGIKDSHIIIKAPHVFNKITKKKKGTQIPSEE